MTEETAMTPAVLDAPTPTTPAGADVGEKVLGLMLHRGKFGHKKKTSTDPISIPKDETTGNETDKTLLALYKVILIAPEMKAIRSVDSRIDKFLALHVLPTPLDQNTLAAPMSLVQTIEGKLRTFRAERDAAAEALAAVYPQRVAETRARLAIIGHEADYPSTADFRARYYMAWDWVRREAPDSLKMVDANLYEAERQKVATKLAAVAVE